MVTWTQQDGEKFFCAVDSYWPNAFRGDGLAAQEAWRDVARRHHPEIALQALRELYEGQERPHLPTLAAFAVVARQVAVALQSLARDERGASGGPTMTPMEFAALDEEWEGIFDRAKSPEVLQFLKGVREGMKKGATGSIVAHALGDFLNWSSARASTPHEVKKTRARRQFQWGI